MDKIREKILNQDLRLPEPRRFVGREFDRPMPVNRPKISAKKLLSVLEKKFPGPKNFLRWNNPFELLAATILSAQCTDVRVNQVAPILFKRFPTPRALAKATQEEVEQIVHSTGFYRNKAKNLRGMAKKLLASHGGEVPDSMDALVALPGVARKTANCVLGSAFGRNEGVVVDTHVGRLARRMGFSKAKNPVQVERDLMAAFPQESWTRLSHLLIDFGRDTCRSRKPRCEICIFSKICPKHLDP